MVKSADGWWADGWWGWMIVGDGWMVEWMDVSGWEKRIEGELGGWKEVGGWQLNR